LNGNQILAQEKALKVYYGFGFTDKAHVGISAIISKAIQPGVQIGYFPTDIHYIRTISATNSITLSTSEKFERVTGNYFKQQINYYEETNSEGQWTWTTLELLLGSNLNFTKHIGIGGELGFFVTLDQYYRKLGPTLPYQSENSDFPNVFPNIRLMVFVRL
jgi:hypothetical protein